ncbi:hypothetical protein [Desertibaculum subflavum]|uniref:hypothetical protein n=1 Tax=Desertibaculum subflavum TaxID=2268458 RepID=UPI000E66806B
MRRFWLILACVIGVAVPAAAADLNISAFYGRWQGNAISETDKSITFAVTARDMDVLIQPAGNGFRVSWTTIRRQKGDPRNPTLEKRAAELVFRPAAQPGIWRAEGSADPMQGQFAWAGIQGRTLTVNVMVIGAGGSYELQSFARRLTDMGMELEFDRIVDGDKVRTAKGRLVKVANN